jgi:predicted dinucleotide-binding enzyme
MATIGLIGSGHIGSTVARLALAGGHEVVLSNRRGPDSLAPLVAELGAGARADTVEGAANAGDIVVVTVPLHAVSTIPAEPLAGKIVIDTNNYYPDRDGRIPELDADTLTTSELVQQHLAGSRVVKAFNHIIARHLAALARPAGSPDRSALLIAGDDAEAKAQVTAFLDSVGYDDLDTGALVEGRRFQRDTPAYCLPYFTSPTDPGPGTPAGADVLRVALAAYDQRG